MWKWADLKRILFRKQGLDIKDLGAVMWPVSYPNPEEQVGGTAYIPKDPHITVVVFKDINNPDLGYTREDVIEAVRESVWNVYLWCKVEGIEWFGSEQDVPVLRVHHDYLPVFYKSLTGILDARGIAYDKTFPDYKPHVTIPDLAALDKVYPDKLLAGPVEVWWGDVHYKVGV